MTAKMHFTETLRAHVRLLLASLFFAIATLPAVAQQQQQPATPNVPAVPYGYGYHHMWGGPWGWHPFMIVGPIIVLLAIVGLMVIFVWLVRWATQGYPFYGHRHHFHGGCPYCGGHGRGALDILDERFARGEIEKAEYEEKRKLLSR